MTPMMLFTLAAALAAAAGIALFMAGRRRDVRAAKWVGVAWLAYAAYEAGVQMVTPEADIRVDLLLFYPLLLLGLAWALIALVRRGKAGAPAS